MIKSENLYNLMKKINYFFKNENILLEALTHRSYLNEHSFSNLRDNERLEFLGDSVMDLIISEYIYKNNLKSNEGELSKIKSQLISEAVFSSISRDLNLGSYIFLSNGECLNGGRERDSILGDAFEALVGAIFEDSDYLNTKKVVLNLFENKIVNMDKIEGISDYKTELQELTQLKYKVIPVYELISESGPDHDKEFEIEVKIANKSYAIAKDKSKKKAEKQAAKLAIRKIKGE